MIIIELTLGMVKGRMVIDILKFFFVYWLVLFSFACGLNQLFWYYATMRQKDCASKPKDGLCEDKFFSFAK